MARAISAIAYDFKIRDLTLADWDTAESNHFASIAIHKFLIWSHIDTNYSYELKIHMMLHIKESLAWIY